MTALHDAMVAGEPLAVLARALAAFKIEERPDDWANVRFDIPPEPGAAMHRAIIRIEAEMLCEDADKLEVAGREARTSRQRRHDAFVVLAQRIGDAVGSRT